MASRKDDKGYVLWKGESKLKRWVLYLSVQRFSGQTACGICERFADLTKKRKRNHKRFE